MTRGNPKRGRGQRSDGDRRPRFPRRSYRSTWTPAQPRRPRPRPGGGAERHGGAGRGRRGAAPAAAPAPFMETEPVPASPLQPGRRRRRCRRASPFRRRPALGSLKLTKVFVVEELVSFKKEREFQKNAAASSLICYCWGCVEGP